MVYVRGVLDSLHRRPRGRELAALLAVLSRGRVPSPLAPQALAARARQQDRRLEELERRDAANTVVHNHLRMREALAQIALGWSLDRHDVPAWPAELGFALVADAARCARCGGAGGGARRVAPRRP